MSGTLIKVSLVVGGVSLLATLIVVGVLALNYRVTARHLQITWFGLPIRWVRLDKVRNIGTTAVFWAEHWQNTFQVGNRRLVIRKRGLLFKNLVITPKNPFVFRAELVRAREAFLSPGPPTAPPEAPSS